MPPAPRHGRPSSAVAPLFYTREPGSRPVAATIGTLASGALAAAFAVSLALLPGCSPSGDSPQFTDHFEHVTTLQVSPVEPFGRLPGSVVLLPDGRFVLPEAGGVWMHVVDANGQGLTRLGGPSAVALGTSRARLGEFRSLSGVTATPDGRLLAGDRTSNVVTIYGPGLAPADTVIVPETRGVLQLEALDRQRIVAAVEPLNPASGGQVVLLGPADSVRGFLAREPIVVHNRWEAIASTALEIAPDGRILAYWPVFPWANVLSPRGEARPRVGRFSKLYQGPSSGPRRDAPIEVLRRWYESFTPLLAVESADSVLAFEYLETEEQPRGNRSPPSSRAVAAQGGGEARSGPRRAFVNLYDLAGKPIARDLRLPKGARILKSNDRSRIYMLTEAAPRELRIDVLRPDPSGP